MTNIFLFQLLLGMIFLTIVFLHYAKKNFGVVIAYGLQSSAIVFFVIGSFFETGHVSLLFLGLLILIVKVILAPIFFARLIKKHALAHSVSTYLNMPLTLIIIAVLTAIAYSEKFSPITDMISGNEPLLRLAVAAIFLSLFLIVNRKGALSQIIGILSLENSIVAFAIFAGLEQSFSLQIGILFDILVWLIIANVFVSMIFRHFGSLNVTAMRHLRE